MIALLRFVLGILAPRHSSRRAGLKLRMRCSTVDRFAAQDARSATADEQRSLVLYSTVSVVSVDPADSHDHPSRDAGALAQGRLSLLLALEVAPTRRATADRDGAARFDPADECRKSAFGARHAFTANCSSSDLRSRSRASPSTWSKRRGPPSQGWRTFLHNHAPDRTHRSLNKDAPVSRQIQLTGSIKSHAILGGLHHHYVRV